MLLPGFTVIEHEGFRCVFSKFSVESCTSFVCVSFDSQGACVAHLFHQGIS